MASTHFDLISHWRIPAPVDRVWAALVDVPGWPGWWRFVRSVRTLRVGDDDGVGRAHRVRWATRLPYRIDIDIEAVEVVRPQRLRARSRGQLCGEAIWLLCAEGEQTDVTCVWRVPLAQAWMRRLAPMLAPVYRWNHRAVMRAGEAGLVRHLAHNLPQRAPTPLEPR